LTISKGISQANSTYGKPSEVLVSAGTYHINTEQTATRIVMVEGISLYGGYDTTFTTRAYDTAHMVEVFNDATNGGTSSLPMGTVSCTGISQATTLDGFTIHAGGSLSSGATQYFSALTIDSGSTVIVTNNNLTGGGNLMPYYDILFIRDSRPTILGNSISGNGGDKTAGACGIYFDDSKADAGTCVIADNTISSGTLKSGSSDGAFGIWVHSDSGATVLIERNTITAGNAPSSSGVAVQINSATTNDRVTVRNCVIESLLSPFAYGIFVTNASPALLNNTIVITSTSSSVICGIDLASGATPRIENNIFADLHSYQGGSHVTFGIYETSSVTVRTVYNNAFWCFDSDTTYWDVYHTSTPSNLHDAAAMESYLTGKSVSNGSNISSTNPQFASVAGHDYHLASTTAVSTGGKDLSASFSDDRGSAKRTVPWSIGAYEKD
jgi:hypothetical protein